MQQINNEYILTRINKTKASRMFEQGYNIFLTYDFTNPFRHDVGKVNNSKGNSFKEECENFSTKNRGKDYQYVLQYIVYTNDAIEYQKRKSSLAFKRWYKKHRK